MITEKQVEAANDYIRDNAAAYGAAKAARIQLSEFRKSKKALLMNQKQGAGHERESYAYADDEYIALLLDIQKAVEVEETIRWSMKAAELKIEIWRTQQANNRMIDNSHR